MRCGWLFRCPRRRRQHGGPRGLLRAEREPHVALQVKRHRALWLPQWELGSSCGGGWHLGGWGRLAYVRVLNPVVEHRPPCRRGLWPSRWPTSMVRMTSPMARRGWPPMPSASIWRSGTSKVELLEQPVYSRLGGAPQGSHLLLRYEQRRRLVQRAGLQGVSSSPVPTVTGWVGRHPDRLCGAGTRDGPVMTLSSCSTVGWPSMLRTAPCEGCGPTA